MNILKQIWTSDVLFGTTVINSWILVLGICQILVTVSFCGFSSEPSVSLFWWPLCDAFRVLVIGCIRMDHLLREQLAGQEPCLRRLRRGLAILNAVGLILAFGSSSYKPMQKGEPLLFFSLTLAALVVHIIATIPAALELLQCQQVVEHQTSIIDEDQVRVPLLGPGETGLRYSGQAQVAPQNQQRQFSASDNAYAVKLTHKESIFHFPQTIETTPSNYERTLPLSADSQDQLSKQRCILSDIKGAVEPNVPLIDPRTAIRQQQDFEYDLMIADHHRKVEEKEHSSSFLEPAEVSDLSPLPQLSPEPSPTHRCAVEIRVKMPDGTELARRFDRGATLTNILDWTRSRMRELNIKYEQGYRLCERFPRKVYRSNEYGLTLEELKFWRQRRQKTTQRGPLLFLELL